MSAFICSDQHISSLATWYGSTKKLPVCLIQLIANDLKSTNIDSVNYRYNEKTRKTKCSFKNVLIIDTETAVGLANCLDYQSCEKDNFNCLLNDIQILSRILHGSNKSNVWCL